MNNIKKVIQNVSKKIKIDSEIKQCIILGFTSTTLFSGSIFGVHSYKMNYPYNVIAKNTLTGMTIGASAYILSPLLIYDFYKNCV